MTKRQLIDEIIDINHSAQPSFLAKFEDSELSEYLDHLHVALTPRTRDDGAECAECENNSNGGVATAVAEMPEWRDETDDGWEPVDVTPYEHELAEDPLPLEGPDEHEPEASETLETLQDADVEDTAQEPAEAEGAAEAEPMNFLHEAETPPAADSHRAPEQSLGLWRAAEPGVSEEPELAIAEEPEADVSEEPEVEALAEGSVETAEDDAEPVVETLADEDRDDTESWLF